MQTEQESKQWQLNQRQSSWRRLASLGKWALLVVAASQLLVAQTDAQRRSFDEMPVTKAAGSSSIRFKVSNIARGAGAIPPADQTTFDAYFRDYELARLTDLKSIAEYHTIREKLIRARLRAAGKTATGTSAVYERINQLCLEVCAKIVQGNYHPASKLNAMLILKGLNLSEPTQTAGAVPYPPTFDVILSALKDPDLPDGVKVVALEGLERHAMAGLADDKKAAVIAVVLPMFTQAKPPNNRSPDGHRWIRQRAARVLGAIGSVGPNNEVLQALATVIGDANVHVKIRCTAARALGMLDYKGVQYDGVAKLAEDLFKTAMDAFDAEVDRLPSMNFAVSKPMVKWYFTTVYQGFYGLTADKNGGLVALTGDGPQKDFVQGIAAGFEPLYSIFDDKDLSDDVLRAKVKKTKREVEAYIDANRPSDAANGVVEEVETASVEPAGVD